MSNFLASTKPLALRLEVKITSFTVEPSSASSARSSFTAAEATAFCKAVCKKKTKAVAANSVVLPRDL